MTSWQGQRVVCGHVPDLGSSGSSQLGTADLQTRRARLRGGLCRDERLQVSILSSSAETLDSGLSCAHGAVWLGCSFPPVGVLTCLPLGADALSHPPYLCAVTHCQVPGSARGGFRTSCAPAAVFKGNAAASPGSFIVGRILSVTSQRPLRKIDRSLFFFTPHSKDHPTLSD